MNPAKARTPTASSTAPPSWKHTAPRTPAMANVRMPAAARCRPLPLRRSRSAPINKPMPKAIPSLNAVMPLAGIPEILAGGLWINPPSEITKQQRDEVDMHNVICVGVFRVGAHGHMGMYSGEISDVRRLQLWRSLGSATRCGLTATITSMIGEQSLLRSSSPGLKPERFPSALRGAEAPLFHSTACPAREAASWRSDRALRVATGLLLGEIQQHDI